MRTRVAPNFANVYMGRFEENFVYKTEGSNYVILWVRFTDDIFLIWKGDTDSLTIFIDHLNNAATSITFTHEISANSVNFLDTTVLKDRQGNISTDVYQKPTDTHPYLHWTSAHPPHLKQSIPCSQALRLRRICSSTDTLKKRIIEYADFVVACGYQRSKVLLEMKKSPYNDTRRMCADQRKGIHRSHPPGHYIQPTYHPYCRDCKTKLELPSI